MWLETWTSLSAWKVALYVVNALAPAALLLALTLVLLLRYLSGTLPTP